MIDATNLYIDFAALDTLEREHQKKNNKFFQVLPSMESVPKITDSIDSIIPIPGKSDYVPAAKNIQYEIVERQDFKENVWCAIIAKCILENGATATVEHEIK